MKQPNLVGRPLGSGLSAEALDSHYSDGFAIGNLIFVSGQLPVDPEFQLVGSNDVEEQARQIFRNIEVILDEAGAAMSDVVAVTLYLMDISDIPRIAGARREAFGNHKPSSTAVQVSGLALPGAQLEISAIACRHPESQMGVTFP